MNYIKIYKIYTAQKTFNYDRCLEKLKAKNCNSTRMEKIPRK